MTAGVDRFPKDDVMDRFRQAGEAPLDYQKPQETRVDFTLASAENLKKKHFGRMSPVAVVSVAGGQISQVSNPSINAGTSPTWDQTLSLNIPDAVLQSQNPKPSISVEIFSSSDLKKSLGQLDIPLARAMAAYDEPKQYRQSVIRRSSPRGILHYAIKVHKPSFAPNRGTPAYDDFVKRLVPPPPPPRPKPRPQVPAYGYPVGGPYPYPQGYPAQGYPPHRAYGYPPAYGTPYGAHPQVVYMERPHRGHY